MSVAYDLISGAFGHAYASFAHEERDKHRAIEYLLAAVTAQVTWAEAEEDIRLYLKDCTSDFIERQLARARPRLAPWLSS